MATSYLSLGSNIDDRMAFLVKAEAILSDNKNINIVKSSKVYETEPWPKENHSKQHPHHEGGQKWFLNQVIKIETDLSPQKLLELNEEIEKEIGRTEKDHWGPREIDVDILLYNDLVIESPELQIPHRHMHDRQFILVPLIEIAPDLKDPSNGKTFSDILEEIRKEDSHKVTPFL